MRFVRQSLMFRSNLLFYSEYGGRKKWGQEWYTYKSGEGRARFVHKPIGDSALRGALCKSCNKFMSVRKLHDSKDCNVVGKQR